MPIDEKKQAIYEELERRGAITKDKRPVVEELVRRGVLRPYYKEFDTTLHPLPGLGGKGYTPPAPITSPTVDSKQPALAPGYTSLPSPGYTPPARPLTPQGLQQRIAQTQTAPINLPKAGTVPITPQGSAEPSRKAMADLVPKGGAKEEAGYNKLRKSIESFLAVSSPANVAGLPALLRSKSAKDWQKRDFLSKLGFDEKKIDDVLAKAGSSVATSLSMSGGGMLPIPARQATSRDVERLAGKSKPGELPYDISKGLASSVTGMANNPIETLGFAAVPGLGEVSPELSVLTKLAELGFAGTQGASSIQTLADPNATPEQKGEAIPGLLMSLLAGAHGAKDIELPSFLKKPAKAAAETIVSKPAPTVDSKPEPATPAKTPGKPVVRPVEEAKSETPVKARPEEKASSEHDATINKSIVATTIVPNEDVVRINGKAQPKGERAALLDGDIVEIGGKKYAFSKAEGLKPVPTHEPAVAAPVYEGTAYADAHNSKLLTESKTAQMWQTPGGKFVVRNAAGDTVLTTENKGAATRRYNKEAQGNFVEQDKRKLEGEGNAAQEIVQEGSRVGEHPGDGEGGTPNESRGSRSPLDAKKGVSEQKEEVVSPSPKPLTKSELYNKQHNEVESVSKSMENRSVGFSFENVGDLFREISKKFEDSKYLSEKLDKLERNIAASDFKSELSAKDKADAEKLANWYDANKGDDPRYHTIAKLVRAIKDQDVAGIKAGMEEFRNPKPPTVDSKAEPAKPPTPPTETIVSKPEERPMGPLTGGSNKFSEAERAQINLSPVERQLYQDVGDSYAEGRRGVQEGKVNPETLAEKINKKPRNLSAEETGALIYNKARLYEEYNRVAESLDAAIVSKDAAKIKELQGDLDGVRKRIDQNTNALVKAGREWSMAGRARQALADLQGNFVNPAQLIQEAVRRRGRSLNPEEEARYRSMAEELKKANEEIDRLKARPDKPITEAEAEKAKERIRRSVSRRQDVKAIREAREKSVKSIVDQIKKIRPDIDVSLHMAADPTLGKLNDVEFGVIAKEVGNVILSYIKEGTVNLAELVDKTRTDLPFLSEEQVHQALSGYGLNASTTKTKSQLQQNIADLKKEARLTIQLNRELADIETRTRKNPYAPIDNARAKELREQIANIRKVRDLDEKIDALKKELASGNLTQKTKGTPSRTAQEQELLDLQKKKRDLLAERQRAATAPERAAKAEKAKLERQIKAQENLAKKTQEKIDNLNKRIAARDTSVSKPTVNSRPKTAAQEALDNRVKELNSQLAKIRAEEARLNGLRERAAAEEMGIDTRTKSNRPELTEEEKALQRRINKERTLRDIGEETKKLQEQLARGEYSDYLEDERKRAEKRQQARTEADPEVRKARAAREDARYRIEKTLEMEKYANDPKALRALRALYSIPRDILVFGHGTSAMLTHAGSALFKPTTWDLYFKNFGRQFGYWLNKPFHDDMMGRIRDKANYQMKIDAGLAIRPDVIYDDYQKYGKGIGIAGERGNMGFDALKSFRDELFDKEWDKLDATEQTPERAQLLATWVNHVTGTSNVGHGATLKAMDAAFFAPRLMGARAARTIGDPYQTVKGFLPDATPEARAMSKFRLRKTAEHLATLGGFLAANQAFLSAIGSTHKVNVTDPSKSDWMKFKTPEGETLNFDGNTAAILQAAGDVAAIGVGHKPTFAGRGRREQMLTDAASWWSGQSSPQVGLGLDVLSQEAFGGRPLPWSKEPGTEKRPKYTPSEYFTSRFIPIPFAGGARELYTAFREQGLDASQARDWTTAFVYAAKHGAVGPLDVVEAVGIKKGKEPKEPQPKPRGGGSTRTKTDYSYHPPVEKY